MKRDSCGLDSQPKDCHFPALVGKKYGFRVTYGMSGENECLNTKFSVGTLLYETVAIKKSFCTSILFEYLHIDKINFANVILFKF